MATHHKKPTMSDIAQSVGVSQATVSLVINNAPGTRISPVTRERVLRVAISLGYEKISSLHKPGRMIGLLINELTTSQHAAGLIEFVREEAAAHDCLVTVIATQGIEEVEFEALEYLLGRPLVGIIYATLLTQGVKPPHRLHEVPTVLLNCHSIKNDFPSVVPSDIAGGFTATSALLDAGHKRIAMINGEDWIQASRDRLLGYRQALNTYDIAVDPALIVSGGWTFGNGRNQTHKLLDLQNPPTAIFCYCDRMALGAYEAVRSRGLRIPQDVSIVGFDNEAFAAEMEPPLTTIILPHEDMARWAVSRLLENGSSKSISRKYHKLKMECELVQRESISKTEIAGSHKSVNSININSV